MSKCHSVFRFTEWNTWNFSNFFSATGSKTRPKKPRAKSRLSKRPSCPSHSAPRANGWCLMWADGWMCYRVNETNIGTGAGDRSRTFPARRHCQPPHPRAHTKNTHSSSPCHLPESLQSFSLRPGCSDVGCWDTLVAATPAAGQSD